MENKEEKTEVFTLNKPKTKEKTKLPNNPFDEDGNLKK